MQAEQIHSLLAGLNLDDEINEAQFSFFEAALRELERGGARQLALPTDEPSRVSLRLLAMAIERLALNAGGTEAERHELFELAFVSRRAAEFDGPSDLRDLALLAVDGLLAESTPELSMFLRELPPERIRAPEGLSWVDEVVMRSARALLLLCRRSRGWTDVREAAAEIDSLRALQAQHEPRFIEGTDDPAYAAASLIGAYNVARMVDIVAEYVASGRPVDAGIQLERHASNAQSAFAMANDRGNAHLAELLRAGLLAMIEASIWNSTRRLGASIRQFVEDLASEGAREPILELWPSQRKALQANLLDPARRAVVVEMPTSAGKTLVAEFAIVQALALNPESKVAYIVPTRALANQLSRRLRHDLAPLGHRVESAVPVFELDPTEDTFLRQPFQVLVVTPEKFDLLIRSDHPASQDLSLVVVDEAHNLAGDDRGTRLEFLLAAIKRERADARFLLLTPFVPNAPQLAAWLGDEAEVSVGIDWRPSERVAAAATWKKPRGQPWRLTLTTLPSAHRVDVDREIDIDLGEVASDMGPSKERVSLSLVDRLDQRGGVLVLASGRKRAEQRAVAIAATRQQVPPTELSEAVVHLAAAELGSQSDLPRLIERGVAFHHAGVSHDLRYLIEMLIDEGSIGVVCGTSTLAQGVNFPIASVIVESLTKPVTTRNGRRGTVPLSFAEFWNIAGRAGRAMKDRLGLVLFPAADAAGVATAREFLRGDAAELVSSLSDAIEGALRLEDSTRLAFVRSHPQLSVFLQYLLHAMRVAGPDQARGEIEDILRSSFGYYQLRIANHELAERLVALGRDFLDRIGGRNPGQLALVDSTGFSLPSVDYLYASGRAAEPQMNRPDFWAAQSLFAQDLDNLTAVIDVIGKVPELTLGREEVGPFNPRMVAGVIRDWVDGRSVQEIADTWFERTADPAERLRQAGTYLHSTLVGQVPWGVGALQQLFVSAGEPLTSVAHIPSLIFYGVGTKEAATMRMAGVPRIAAEGLARQWVDGGRRGETFAEVRDWVAQRQDTDWGHAMPDAAPVSGRECRLAWQALTGTGESPTGNVVI